MKNIAKKNQIIITTLAIMIAVAGFLNYSGREDKKAASSSGDTAAVSGESVDTADISDEDLYAQAQGAIAGTEIASGESLSEDTTAEIESLDNDPAETVLDASSDNVTQDTADASLEEGTPGEAVLANSSAVAGIADLKLTREQARSKNKETLLAIVNNESLTDEQKQGAIDKMVDLTDVSEKEAAAEILLAAKGYSDVVVNIENDGVDVIVNATELTDTDRAKIEDIVKRKTGISGENIVITTLNSAK